VSDEQPIDFVQNDNAAEDVAKILEAAAANGLSQMAHGVPHEVSNHLATMSLLATLGDRKVRKEDSLRYEGTSFVLPESYRGNISGARRFLKEFEENQLAKIDLVRVFAYRPYDVAHAVHQALVKVFGYSGKGIAIKQMFGDIEPAMIDVATGIDQRVQVPWNRVAFTPLDGHLDISYQKTPNGLVGQITINAPRGLRQVVEGFFEVVETELRENSIYRGKAIVQTPEDNIDFLDLSKVKREDVVYNAEVMSHLEANLWIVLRNLEDLRNAGQPIKRAVLLEGPYGTGKTLAAYLTAQEAVANGVTFIFAKPGADLNQAMHTAQLYAPAVVFFEDIDTLDSNDPEEVSNLLDTFDGIGGKGKEVIAVLTTNNRDKIHKGLLRPGRLDALVHIAELDLEGVQRLIEVSLRDSAVKLIGIDYRAVFEACQGYLPAFVGEVATRAFRYAMVRQNGMPEEITTEDLVKAAHGLRPQFDLMTGAHEIQEPPTLEKALHNTVAGVLEKTVIKDGDGDPSYYVREFAVERR
jgi:AAA+ superfamily predicted ATPase